MASSLRSKLNLLIGLTGTLVFCLGVFILASGIVIRDLLNGLDTFAYGNNLNCQYWAGIPTILTGSILVLAVIVKRHQFLKYIGLCCVLITMVLTLGIIIEESSTASYAHFLGSSDDSYFCGKNSEVLHNQEYKDECLKLKEAHPWYYIMLFAADIVFVSCSFVTLILFGDWILFVAPRTPDNNGMAYYVHQDNQSG